MKIAFNYIKLSIIFIALVFIDQATKLWAVAELKGKEAIEIIPKVFELNFLEGGNTGAAWGILSGRLWLFIIFTIIISVLVVVVIVRINHIIQNNYSLKSDNNINLKVFQLVFVLLLSGAVGNVIDRIFRGYVIDFLYFKLINFPIFNVADCYVVLSCILLVVMCIFFIDEKTFNTVFSFRKNKDE